MQRDPGRYETADDGHSDGTPASRAVLRQNFETQQDLGCRVEWLEPDELQVRYPSMRVDDLGGSVFSPDDGWLDPHAEVGII